MSPVADGGARRRCILLALGSAGDVLPFIAVGQALRASGCAVCVGSNPRVEALVRAAGLDFKPIGSLRDADRTESHPRLWHPVDGFGVLWRHLVVPALQPSFDWVKVEHAQAQARGERLSVVASPLALGARVARECLAFDLVTVSLSPMNMAGVDDPMFVGPWKVPAAFPRAWRTGLWNLLERLKLAPLLAEHFLPWRASLGLAPLSQMALGPWMRSPDRHQAWFPAWFAPVDSAWSGVEQFDFPLIGDPEMPGALAEADQAFLDAGPPVVIIYPGSGRMGADAMVHRAMQAVRAAGLRGLVVSPHWCGVPDDDPAVRHVPRARFDLWMPRAVGVVHHGGVGTIGQAFRAGCPQLIWPSSFDQHENAWHVARLGQGQTVRGLSPGRWRRGLSHVLAARGKARGGDGRDSIATAILRA